jgi:uncharacterized protein YutE (UPF0331/DUF86 family)
VDREVINSKLDSLQRSLLRIETKCPATAGELIASFDLQDIVALNLSRAIQISVDIGAHLVAGLSVPPPGTIGQTFDLLAQEKVLNVDLANRMKKAVGFRNIAVHSYETINWDIVHSIVHDHLHEFSQFAKAITVWMDQQP